MKRPVDLFLASFRRPERLAAMLESVRATRYPARVLVAAGDAGTIETCEKFKGLAECVYSTGANARIGCTAPLNLVFGTLVRHDALFCTDDCLFATDCLDIAMTTLYERFPDADGVVGLCQQNIPGAYDLAFPLIGRKFQERLIARGDLFFPGYYHLFNDAELGVTVKCLGNWVFEPRALIRHAHPDSGTPADDTFRRGFTHQDADRAAWCRRRARGDIWGLDDVPNVARA